MLNKIIFNLSSIFKSFRGVQVVNNLSKVNYCIKPSNTSNFKTLYNKSLSVHPLFGKLILNSHCNTIICPANLQEYPDANFASISLWSDKESNAGDEIEMKLQEDELKLRIPHIHGGLCKILLPIKYDLEADLENECDLRIEKMESDNIEVSTKRGSITTANVRSKDVSFQTDTGSITAEGVLQGNLYISAKKTVLKAQRLQGLNLSIQAGSLETDIESSYIDKGVIYAESGNLNIKHLHGSTKLHLQNGKVSLGLSGSLQAVVDEGDVHVQVSKVEEDSYVQLGEGNLSLAFSDASSINMDICGPTLDIPEDIKCIGTKSNEEGVSNFKSGSQSGSALLKAHVDRGIVKLSTVDWFASLGIKT